MELIDIFQGGASTNVVLLRGIQLAQEQIRQGDTDSALQTLLTIEVEIAPLAAIDAMPSEEVEALYLLAPVGPPLGPPCRSGRNRV